ncbi:Npt1/Npt2 family nucleotide transporter [Alphaproteobacteria bacterium endosymbiont of Tiliacea citrago]|uniref:Npt1/Npt2 family nucleotide transporter n=1 Tax=Alphaproteobacteria bacterium endosymbiont of Tiliacea citrago TaxID=3077944 RepID=UPI00313AD204
MKRESWFSSFFSSVRSFFWPIYGQENIKFISLLLMFTSSIFCYGIVRIHKDTYILSAPLATANTISFLKMYFVMPISILYFVFFCWLTNKVSKEKAFLFSVFPLLLFFSLFYLFFLPNISSLHMSVETLKKLQTQYPSVRNFFPVIAYWMFSFYYVFAELIGTIVVTFLFWGFANYCVTKEEKIRFYPLFVSYSYIISAIGSYLQGMLFSKSSKFKHGSLESNNALFLNFYLIVGSLLFFIAVYYFINNYVVTNETNSENFSNVFKMKPKHKISFSDSIKTIIQNKNLMYILGVIICYGVTTNLIEVTWKELIRKQYNGCHAEIGYYLSNFYFILSAFVISTGFLNKFLLARFNWGLATSFSPALLFLSSFIFFGLIVFESYIPPFFLLGYSAAALAVHVGFIQDALAKSGRYAVLDPNLQMVYSSLPEDTMTKGKASVDMIGSRFGKSIGSFLESSLSMLFNGADQIALAPIFMPVVLLSCGLWVFFLLMIYASLPSLQTKKAE